MKRFLLLSALRPHPSHTVRAANVVVFEMALELARQFPGKVGLLVAWEGIQPPPISADEAAGLEQLKRAGVEVLTEVMLRPRERRPLLVRTLAPVLSDFYLAAADLKPLAHAVSDFQPDVVLVPWTEWLTAAASQLAVPKFAYYGNPDPKSQRAQLAFRKQHGELSLLREARWRLWIHQLEQMHLKTMRECRWVGNVAANDAGYYAARGHPNAFYIQNIWIDRLGGEWHEARRDAESRRPRYVLGSVGKLAGTANTLGLQYLGEEVLPARRRVNGAPYRIGICGGGECHAAVRRLLESPEIEFHGFVDDIDQEILSAGVFLCVNNGTSYNVGHTRYLHAWSLGACVVAHRAVGEAMPELVHRENALLGSSGAEIAELIEEALAKPALRAELGQAGYATFKRQFVAPVVVSRILQRIQAS